MKNRTLWTWSLGLALTLPFLGGCVQEASSSTENNAPDIKAGTDSEVATQSPADNDPLALEEEAPEEISNAAVRPISTEKTPPPNLKVAGPVSEIVKLADSGVDESVMLAFVNKSMSTFNLRSDEIIYLKDIGVPNSVVTAMIQRDEALKQGPVDPIPLTAQGPEIATEPQPAPQTDYATEPYVPSVSAPLVEPTYSNFYDSLSPYGSWVEVDGYGRCWQPTTVVVNSGWRPYFDGGRWVYTDCGWYWHSDYSWGWAPFHYGRWFRHERIGWCWTPDTVWGPSWVSWRYNNDYCGWAPLPPRAHFRPGFGFASHGRADFGLGIDSFAFIPFSHFRDHHLRHHALPHDQVTRIFNQTTVSTRIQSDHNRVVNRGITPERVAAATRAEVPRLNIHETSVAGGRGIRSDRLERNGSTLSVFRPALTGTPGTLPTSSEQTRTDRHTGASASFAGRSSHAIAQPERTDAVRSTGPDTLSRGHSGRATPLIVHGPDRSTQAERRDSTIAPRETASHNSVIVIGRKDATTGRSLPPQQNDSGRSIANQNSQQLAAMASQPRPPSYPPWAVPTVNESSDRVERQQPVLRQQAPSFSSGFENRSTARATISQPEPAFSRQSAPAYEATPRTMHSETPRYNPGPSSAPQHTYSAPAMESHAHSAPPSAPPASSSSSHSHSSDRNSR